MTTRPNTRRQCLMALADQHAERGGLAHVAELAGLSYESLQQIVKGTLLPPKADGSRTARGLGNAAARKIEVAFGLEPGAMDLPPSITKMPSTDGLVLAAAFDSIPQRTPPEREIKRRIYFTALNLLDGPVQPASVAQSAAAMSPTEPLTPRRKTPA